MKPEIKQILPTHIELIYEFEGSRFSGTMKAKEARINEIKGCKDEYELITKYNEPVCIKPTNEPEGWETFIQHEYEKRTLLSYKRRETPTIKDLGPIGEEYEIYKFNFN
jgi:hypothetical protein